MGFIGKEGFDSHNKGYKPKNDNVLKLKQFLKKNELPKK